MACTSAITAQGDGGRNWSGFIDEFAIYGNALTEIEVADLYRGAFGTDPPEPPDPTEGLADALNLTVPVAGPNVTLAAQGWGVQTFPRRPGPRRRL